jgi:hypothetical protein
MRLFYHANANKAVLGFLLFSILPRFCAFLRQDISEVALKKIGGNPRRKVFAIEKGS